MIDLLFVHPDQKLSDLYARTLSKHFRVHCAVDGLSAVRKTRVHLPKIVVTEYELPLLSGSALVKFIRSHPSTAQSLLIFLSSKNFDHHALNLGANVWLPQHESTPEKLLTTIATYVQIY